MGVVVSAGGGRAARAFRLLFLLVVALAAVEYLFCSILDASPLRTYLYMPFPHASSQLEFRSREKSSASWPKRLPISSISTSLNPKLKNLTHTKNSSKNSINSTVPNMTAINGDNAIQILAINATREKNKDRSTPLLITKIIEGIKNVVATEKGEVKRNKSLLPFCELSPDLGPIPVNKTYIPLDSIQNKFPEVKRGGRYAPMNCMARNKVAIIVPYRNRQKHLPVFLNHMHPFLMKQQLEYGIFIVEQKGNKTKFNRAKLFNVGFVESQKLKVGGWQCFIFHDVDLLPLDLRCMYSCPRQPRLLAASIDKHNFRFLYEDFFGGVSAMTYEQFIKVNGFSNKYWGWGGEDDDISHRLRKNNYHITRYNMSIARYAMLDHKIALGNPKRFRLLKQTSKNWQKDGLSTLQYDVIQIVQHRLFTLITVNIDQP